MTDRSSPRSFIPRTKGFAVRDLGDLERKLTRAIVLRNRATLDRLADEIRASVAQQDRPTALRRVALAYISHREKHVDPRSADVGVSFAREALAALPTEGSPGARTEVLDTLANALYRSARDTLDAEQFAEAEQRFSEALALVNAESEARTWCTVANSLASVSASRFQIDGDPQYQERAARHYRAVRRVAANQGLRQIWADAANNLLRMERVAAAAAGDTSRLRRALAQMRRVLRVRSAGASPQQLADNRLLIAITQQEIADRDYDRPLVDQAIELLRENATPVMRRSEPERFAQARNSIAVAWMTIGEKEGDYEAYLSALDALSDICDFPSLRGRHNRRRPIWHATVETRQYFFGLTNAIQVRIHLAEGLGRTELLDDCLVDLNEVTQNTAFKDREIAATLEYLRAHCTRALWSSTRRPEWHTQTLKGFREAGRIFADVGSWSSYASAMGSLAQFLVESAPLSAPHLHHREASRSIREALRRLPPAMTDARMMCERLRFVVRIAVASSNRSTTALVRVINDIDEFLEHAPATIVQRDLLVLARVDAHSAVSRITLSKARIQRYLAVIDEARSGCTVLVPEQQIRLDIAYAHALQLLERREDSIDAWTAVQEKLRSRDRKDIPISLVAKLSNLEIGASENSLGLGQGLSIADELAVLLLDRNRSGDLDLALKSIDRGRSILAASRRAVSGPTLKLLDQLRHVEGKLLTMQAPDTKNSREAAFFDGVGGSSEGIELRRKKDRLERRIASNVGIPVTPTALSVGRSLGRGMAVIVIASASTRGGLIVIEKDAEGAVHANASILPELARTKVDELLFSPTSDRVGLQQAIDTIRQIEDYDGRVNEAQLANAIAGLETALAMAEAALNSALFRPLAQMLSPKTNRLFWIVPGCLWDFPLHAFVNRPDGPMFTSSYLRSIRELYPVFSRKRFGVAGSLVVDLLADGKMRTPYEIAAVSTAFPDAEFILPVGSDMPQPKALASRLGQIRDFLFNGHGWIERARPELSGLVINPLETGADRLLTTAMLRALPRRPRGLAVLSACDLGAIETSLTPDEFFGTSSEFLDAGFRHVVAASWPVEQNATASLLARFMIELPKHGRDPAEALTTSQAWFSNAARSSDRGRVQRAGSKSDAIVNVVECEFKRLPSPYFWAAFRCLGGLEKGSV